MTVSYKCKSIYISGIPDLKECNKRCFGICFYQSGAMTIGQKTIGRMTGGTGAHIFII